jgi:hypothetical protein
MIETPVEEVTTPIRNEKAISTAITSRMTLAARGKRGCTTPVFAITTSQIVPTR